MYLKHNIHINTLGDYIKWHLFWPIDYHNALALKDK